MIGCVGCGHEVMVKAASCLLCLRCISSRESSRPLEGAHSLPRNTKRNALICPAWCPYVVGLPPQRRSGLLWPLAYFSYFFSAGADQFAPAPLSLPAQAHPYGPWWTTRMSPLHSPAPTLLHLRSHTGITALFLVYTSLPVGSPPSFTPTLAESTQVIAGCQAGSRSPA